MIAFAKPMWIWAFILVDDEYGYLSVCQALSGVVTIERYCNHDHMHHLVHALAVRLLTRATEILITTTISHDY